MTSEPSALRPAGPDPIAAAVESRSLSEIELAWADHLGHTLGKRLPAASFLQRAAAERVGFCDATLSWDVTAAVHEGARLTDWHTGFPDLYATPASRHLPPPAVAAGRRSGRG